jgi:hypothetical protein
LAHFFADYVFAIPLFLMPTGFLTWLGWPAVDPLAARLVAAALMGVGGASLIARHEGPETYRALLKLKILWGAAAMVGLLLSLAEGASRFAVVAFAFFAIFVAAWTYYLKKL